MRCIYLYIYIIIIITNLKLTKMKISELIAKLEIIKERSGDTELTFKVKDGYDRYGYDMDFDLRVGDTTGDPTDWCGSYTNAGWTKLDFYLRNENNKYPKVTFRK